MKEVSILSQTKANIEEANKKYTKAIAANYAFVNEKNIRMALYTDRVLVLVAVKSSLL